MKERKDMTKEEMYLENENLVYFMAGKLHVSPNDFDYEDIISEGKLALWKAVQSFDKKQSAFSTYACNVIKNQMCVYLNTKATRDGKVYYDNGVSLDTPIDKIIQEFTKNNSFKILEIDKTITEEIKNKSLTNNTLKIYLDNLRKTEKSKSVQIFFDHFDGMKAEELNKKYNLKGKMYCRYLSLGRDILKERIKRDLHIERI